MSIKFEIVDDDLHIYLNNGLYDKITKDQSEEYCFFWEPGGSGDYIINQLSNSSSDEFPDGLGFHEFYKSEAFNNLSWIGLFKKDGLLSASYSITFEYKEWQNPFKVFSLVELYKRRLQDLGYRVDVTHDEYEVSINVHTEIESSIIIHAIEGFATIARSEYLKLENELIKESHSGLVSKIFNFPKGFETVCSQYVLWFGELLESIGIEASVSAENKGEHTFLTIEPKNDGQLKDEIERALYLYLSLPYSEYLPAKTDKTDIETRIFIQSLQQQVSFFEQQLEMKKSVIELQSLANDKLKTELEAVNHKKLLLESMQNSRVDILDGAVSIKEYSIGPIAINPRKLLKIIGVE
ncbi:hypothetical protein [Marinomonas mediterranea]|uniref:Uncharacterized protein n=1 Tax=Marinomonas mediterranea (strain ATCC 700492 / JCM 21426 / NBRC 103028 / MMB-1) TaxID=717774 RepID=F2JYY1_MARM1|nr:hypothetical protein [Marinomonas mediterranea]ADZ90846.1 hypothetical protein Marme_1582 [Marinomonas mediterranea MMB-1]WCN16998.1 hypothetical protein GV053_08035 [Marinomonas mediterranea MMB-1]